jgi:acyl-coenzyme A synthetase/AMP-(fatty) acid ligase
MPADIVSIIKEHRVSGISAVPAIWAAFLSLPNCEEALQAVSTVRYITISGGDLAPNQLERLGALLRSTRIFKTYGQTETFRSTILLPSEYRSKMLSVGRPVKGTRVVIAKAKGKLAKPNEVGEILHCGDGTMAGYIGDARRTSRKLRFSPFQEKHNPYRQRIVFTGDIGRMDADGYLYVLGRRDKMIKSSGYRVYPKEVSDQLLRHSAVQEAVVFGVANERIGKAIYAEVQLKPGSTLTEVELKQFLADKLPPYMSPARVVFVSSFPRTASGKIRLSEVEGRYHEER